MRRRLRIRQWVEFRRDRPPVRRGRRGVVVDLQPEDEVYTVELATCRPVLVSAYREDLRPLAG